MDLHPLKVRYFKSLFDDHTAGERKRPATHHGEVIDRSADGYPPYIPAWEEEGPDDVRNPS